VTAIKERFLVVLLLLASVVLIAALLLTNPILPNYRPLPVVKDLAFWFVSVAALAAVLRFTFKRHAAPLLVALVATHFTLVIGINQVLIVLGWNISCMLLGSLVLRLVGSHDSSAKNWLSQLWIGTACWLAIFSILVHFPVNSRTLYCGLLLLPLGLLLQPQQRTLWLTTSKQRLNQQLQALCQARYWLIVVQVLVLGYFARYAFLPTLGFDDQALHLRLWTELRFFHQAQFDVITNVWALAPFAVDLQHALLSLIAGDDIRAALNLYWAGLLTGLVWRQLSQQQLGQQQPSYAIRTLLLLVFASTPMLVYLLISLQTELFLAVLAMSALGLIVNSSQPALIARLPGLLAIAALCCATKLPGAVLGCLLLAAALSHFLLQSRHLAIPHLPTANVTLTQKLGLLMYLAVLAIAALHSYGFAWHRTGNPLFPLYNSLFQSPFFDSSTDFRDERWIHGFSFNSYWQVFFNTSMYHEGEKFVAGFQYLLLVPVALVATVLRQSWRHWLVWLIPLLGFGLLMFANTQYWRYLFPILPLASVVLGTLYPLPNSSLNTHNRLTTVAASGCLLLCLALNGYFLTGISWLFSIAPYQALTTERRQQLIATYAPTTAITEFINELNPNSRVLYTGNEPYGSLLHGAPIYPFVWYSPTVMADANAAKDTAAVRAYMQQYAIDYVIWDITEPLPKWLLGQVLSQYAFPEHQINNVILYRLEHSALAWRSFYSAKTLVSVTDTLQPTSTLDLARARALRYNMDYACPSATGNLAIRLVWDVGAVYSRSLPCSVEPLAFSEALPVPPSAQQVTIYLSSSQSNNVEVRTLSMDRL
jgi:hypothetical protein